MPYEKLKKSKKIRAIHMPLSKKNSDLELGHDPCIRRMKNVGALLLQG